MSEDSDVTLSRGLPETVLPDPPPGLIEDLAAATATPAAERLAAVARVAAAHPRLLEPWAELAELAAAAGDDVAAYAYARVGYHRGLDALRAAGWRGSGYVRWRHVANRGFLRSVDALRRQAAAIGERDEEERCELFCYQLDPDWGRAARS
ncbi:MAG TPA: DUF3151 family protein [Acidimicrobiales bacterium]|nr:DUF3151 family protein [Acidimicrobiales bacterium]